MMPGGILILLVIVLLVLAPPVVIAAQGWLRDRARKQVVDRFAKENRGVLVASGCRMLEIDPSVQPVALTANSVRCLDASRLSLTSLRLLVGGEMRMATGNMTLTRDEATERLRAEARVRGYDALVGLRYETSMIMPPAVEVVAYATAVCRLRARHNTT